MYKGRFLFLRQYLFINNIILLPLNLKKVVRQLMVSIVLLLNFNVWFKTKYYIYHFKYLSRQAVSRSLDIFVIAYSGQGRVKTRISILLGWYQ